MNPLGINLWNWCAGLSEECLGLPEKVARMGFTAVELPMTQPQVPSALADEIRNTGLAVSLCAALGPGRDLSSFDSAVRASTMDYLTTCLETAGQLGAGILAGPLYTGGGKRHWLSPDEKKREWMLAVDGLRELARRAEHYGVVLSVEPLNRYRTSVANTAGQVLRMVEEVDAPSGRPLRHISRLLGGTGPLRSAGAGAAGGKSEPFSCLREQPRSARTGSNPLGGLIRSVGALRLRRAYHDGDLCAGRSGFQLGAGALRAGRIGAGGTVLSASIF